jgi:hypothetical protein
LFEYSIPRFQERAAEPRSLGFGRDDKKERVVPRKGRLLNRGIFQNQFGQVWLSLAQDASLGLDSKGRLIPAGTAENRPRRNPGQPSAVPEGLNSQGLVLTHALLHVHKSRRIIRPKGCKDDKVYPGDRSLDLPRNRVFQQPKGRQARRRFTARLNPFPSFGPLANWDT